MASTLYRTDAPGDWGVMQAPAGATTGTGRVNSPHQHPHIFYRYWHVNGPATILLMHGLGAHSGWFIDMGNHLAAQGINVYAMDHQGFGRSGGIRGHVSNWKHYLEDIDRTVDIIRRDIPDKPIFMFGHSMGGVFATQYAAQHPEKLGGAILMNPWIADPGKLSLSVALPIILGGMVGSKSIGVLPDPGLTTGMTTNPDAVTLLENDTFWVRQRTKAFYWQITRMRSFTLARASTITIPMLVIQGERDVSVVPAATRQAFDRIPSKDKTFISYPEYEHDTEFAIDRSQLDTDIVSWIKARSV